VKPVIDWTPVIAPGSLTLYNGAMLPAWKGSALIGGLASRSLSRITFDGKGGASSVERWNVRRQVRDIAVASDGAIWIVENSSTGGLYRITPNTP